MSPSISLDALSFLDAGRFLPGRTVPTLELSCPISRRGNAHIVRSIQQVDREAWDAVTDGHGLYARRAFLAGAARAQPADGQQRHVVFSRDGVPTGVASLALTRVRGPGLGSLLPEGPATDLLAWATGVGSRPLSLPVLVCGTSFGPDGTGSCFVPGVDPRDAMAQLGLATRSILRGLPGEQRPVGLLMEEPVQADAALRGALTAQGFNPLRASPDMVLELDPAWHSFEDYTAALKSKFRVKAKRAYSKSAALEVRALDTEAIALHQPRLRELQRGVLSRAEVRLGDGCVDALAPLKRSLGRSLVVQGYLLDGELVGFMSGFEHDGRLDAHSVGFDYGLNRHHSIYPRMLLDYLRIALDRGLHAVHYGRTAEEIKSTIGARPRPTRLWVKHRVELLNPLIGLVTAGVEPKVQPLRQPLKLARVERRAA